MEQRRFNAYSYKVNKLESESNHLDYFPQDIEEVIVSRTSLAVSDALIDRNILATHQLVVTGCNSSSADRGIKRTKQSDAMIPAGEGLGIVDLVETICKKIKHMSYSEITVHALRH